MSKNRGVFDGWVVVIKMDKDGSLLSLVNPINIENLYPTKDGTIVCLSSGKKLVDGRLVDKFLAEEGSREEATEEVCASGKVLREAYESYKIKQADEEARRVAAEVKLEKHKVKLVPIKVQCEVEIDDYAGTCQGRLPLQSGHKIINREQLFITTKDGILLGCSGKDGQVIDKLKVDVNAGEVSGYIGADGKYKLVFKNVRLGVSVIHFETLLETPTK